MRKAIILLSFLLSTGVSNAQFYKSFLPSGDFTDSLAKVVSEFRNNFKIIQGEALSMGEDAEIYNSRLGLPGSVNCMIYRYHSVKDSAASWQALMYKGDNYKDAVKSYKNTVRLVKKSKLLPTDRIGMQFHGDMEEPSKDLGFTVTMLPAKSSDPFYDKFVAEIELLTFYDRWEVHLNLHNKRKDTEGAVGYNE